MTGFGDYEPEDAWDPDDAPGELVENLRRRLDLLGAGYRPDPTATLVERLDEIAERVTDVRRRGDLTARDRIRLRDLDTDILHTRHRLETAR